MKSLFQLDQAGKRVIIDPHALGLKAYRDIWERDKSKDKDKAFLELSYVYFMCDYRSYFSDIVDDEQKHNEVKEAVFGSKVKWKPDVKIEAAIKQYKSDVPVSVLLLEDAKIGISKLREYFKDTDLKDTDRNGKLINDPKKFNDVLKSLSDQIESLDALEQKVKKDIDVSYQVQGGREKGAFEDVDADDEEYMRRGDV